VVKRGLLIALFCVCAALASSGAPAFAVDVRPPKMVKAQMVDTDADRNSDQLVLTYSEPVTHAADADGTYPFTVEGYTIASVQAASGSSR
jgi:hypothetical protein